MTTHSAKTQPTTFRGKPLTEKQMGRAFVIFDRLRKKIKNGNADDASLYQKAAVLVAVGQLSERDVASPADMLSQRKDIKKPGAYFHRCLNESVDGRLNILLAKVQLESNEKTRGDMASQPRAKCSNAVHSTKTTDRGKKA